MSKKQKDSGIDIQALKNEQSGDFESLPLMFCKQPDDNNNYYAYRATFTQEPRQFTSKKGNTYDCADAKLLDVVNDKDVKPDTKVTIILPTVLKNKIIKQGNGTITGKTYDFAGRGKRDPVKGGRKYYDFGVMLREGTLSWNTLRNVLPIREGNE